MMKTVLTAVKAPPPSHHLLGWYIGVNRELVMASINEVIC